MTTWLIISLVAGLVSVGIAVYLYFWVLKQEVGTERAEKVAGWIQAGAKHICVNFILPLAFSPLFWALSLPLFSALILKVDLQIPI